MKRFVIAASLAMLPFLSSAAGSSAHAQGQGHEHDGHGHHAADTGNSALALNQGQRWEMDEHTRGMLVKMEEAFFAADHASRSELNATGAILKEQMDELIAGCTMHGAAHEQLHLFLSGYIPTVDRLAGADDYAGAREAAIELKDHFSTYKQYFR